MEIILDKRHIAFISDALSMPPGNGPRTYGIDILLTIQKTGWAFRSDIEDLLNAFDQRIDLRSMNIDAIAETLGLPWEMASNRPKYQSSLTIEYPALRAEYLAYFLITLERFGFDTYPHLLVNKLLPGILPRSKKIYSTAELEIFWFNKTRHKKASVVLKTADYSLDDQDNGYVKLTNGYRINSHQNLSNEITRLDIVAPKYRRRKEPRSVTCAECGIEWRKGEPDSSAMHRKEHKKRMVYFNPQSLPIFMEAQQREQEPELVTADSLSWKHEQMYIRAQAFRREFEYDFIQWQRPGSKPDATAQGFLFGDDTHAIVGACAFRLDGGGQGQPRWYLDWIWVCPKERRKGHLSKRWSLFRERFGEFALSPPVSDAMKAFLKEKNDLHLLKL